MKITCKSCQFEFEQKDDSKFKFCPHCGSEIEVHETASSQIQEKKTEPATDRGWGKKILHIFSFKGRARRLEFWTINIGFGILSILVFFLGMYLDTSRIVTGIEPVIFAFIILILFECLRLPVAVRRLHDIGKSGWWMIVLILVSMIPYYIGEAICIYVFTRDSQPGANIYGPNPKGIPAEDSDESNSAV